MPPMNAMLGRLKGTSLTVDHGRWIETEDVEVGTFLRTAANATPRLILIPRYDEDEAYNLLNAEAECVRLLKEAYNFPSHLFEKTWCKSNGFAGIGTVQGNNVTTIGYISYFRVLAKMVLDPRALPPGMKKDYYWREMTFLIHQADATSCPTVVCCDLPSHVAQDLTQEFSIQTTFDWRSIQASLLRYVVRVVDGCVWDVSNFVRELERARPDNKSLNATFDFPRHHDLLRHALHNTEVLQVATQTLKDWLEQYRVDQERQIQLQQLRLQPQAQQQPLPTLPSILPSETHYQSLQSSLQLLQNLYHRSASNEARLRNEINLAFNVVSQADTKAMRLISIVTLLLLPATFVSTIFSMSFFNFQPPDGNGWFVSPQFWIYWVIAVPLTAALFGLAKVKFGKF